MLLEDNTQSYDRNYACCWYYSYLHYDHCRFWNSLNATLMSIT